MEEESKILSVNPNDQLYHILKTDTFTYCLICLEDINTTSDGVGEHLTSTNHTESIKRLFKACNPSLLDEIANERFSNLVSKSVFDISVLLGKETCYVSKRDGFWFCLMCEMNIIESNDTKGIIKDNILDHILSDSHVKNVKGVCFLYRLNVNQDFLLLNKSVVYCSVCKDVMQCKELDLLKTAAVHLEMKHANCAMTNSSKFEPSSCDINEESSVTEQGFVDAKIYSENLNTQNISRTELSRKVKDEQFDELKAENLVGIVDDTSVDIIFPNHNNVKQSFNKTLSSEEKTVWICLLCKRLWTPVLTDQSFIVTLSSHFKQQHPDIYLSTPLEQLINWVTFHNDPEKIKLLTASTVRKLKASHRKKFKKNCVTKKHLHQIYRSKADYVCIICMVSMFSVSGGNVVLEHFINHFGSSSHKHCEDENMKLKQTFKLHKKNKTMIKLTKEKKTFKEKFQKKKDKRNERKAIQKRRELSQRLEEKASQKLDPSLTHHLKSEIGDLSVKQEWT